MKSEYSYMGATMSGSELRKAYSYMRFKQMRRKTTEKDKETIRAIMYWIDQKEGNFDEFR